MTHTSEEAARIAAGLSEAQREAILHINAGGTAYRWAKMQTIEALNSRGLVGRKTGPGAFYSPQTAIRWPMTSLGLAVRDHLMKGKSDG